MMRPINWINDKRYHHAYQDNACSELTDEELIMGFIKSYRRSACYADHSPFVHEHLSTDECRYFEYSSGLTDHFNMRWFKEWIKENRPHLLDRLTSLKAFW